MGNGARTEMTSRVAVSDGDVVTFSAYARVPSDTPGNLVAQLAWYASDVAVGAISFDAGQSVASSSVPKRVWVTAEPPAGATHVAGAVQLWRTGTVSSSVNMLMDWALLEKTTDLLPYFDGSYSDPSIIVVSKSWSGTAHASTSLLTYNVPGTGSPYAGQIVPRKRVVIERGGQPIYTGVVEDWNFSYDLSGDSLAEPVCMDGLALISQSVLGSALSNSVELSSDRVGVVLDAIQWPSSQRVLSTGTVDVTNDTVPVDTNPLTYLQKVETSEAGALFVGKAGDLVFRNKTDSQTFASGVVFGPNGIPFSDIEVVYGTEEMVNSVAVSYMTGSTVAGTTTADDTVSIGKYGVIEQKYDTLLTTLSDAEDLAAWQVGLYANPQYRVDSVTVPFHGLPSDQQQQVLLLELGDPVTVEWTPNNVGTPVTQNVVVDSISHKIGPVEHFVTLTLSQTVSAFILDDAVYGILDTGILGF